MIELQKNELIFRFPDVHQDAVCRVSFQRTLRLPDDNREYPLPPGLGRFPLRHVEDHSTRLPGAWTEHGGVVLPMYQGEALWIDFSCGIGSSGGSQYPFALKVAAGKINAVTGDPWTNALAMSPQDYLVVPAQPWLDGFCVQKGQIRQFVAMPLGKGYTAEEQLSGVAQYGGLQIIAYPMKRDRYEQFFGCQAKMTEEFCADVCFALEDSGPSMGLAPGGLMRQQIHEDEFGYDVWDQDQSSRCFVHILNSMQWKAATGTPVPGQPPSAKDYTEAGLPWFDYYDDRLATLSGGKNLSGLDSVAAKAVKLGDMLLKDNEAVQPTKVTLGPHGNHIWEGKW